MLVIILLAVGFGRSAACDCWNDRSPQCSGSEDWCLDTVRFQEYSIYEDPVCRCFNINGLEECVTIPFNENIADKSNNFCSHSTATYAADECVCRWRSSAMDMLNCTRMATGASCNDTEATRSVASFTPTDCNSCYETSSSSYFCYSSILNEQYCCPSGAFTPNC